MRNIKFRGKTGDGEWKFGDLSHNERGQSFILISMGGGYDVVPETVGQYTGMKDKNGKEVYEGDILKPRNNCPSCVVKYGEFTTDMITNWAKHTFKTFVPNLMGWYAEEMYGVDKGKQYLIAPNSIGFEIIGNIHDTEVKNV